MSRVDGVFPTADEGGRAWRSFIFLRYDRKRYKITTSIRARPATPPTTPPTIWGVGATVDEFDPALDPEPVDELLLPAVLVAEPPLAPTPPMPDDTEAPAVADTDPVSLNEVSEPNSLADVPVINSELLVSDELLVGINVGK